MRGGVWLLFTARAPALQYVGLGLCSSRRERSVTHGVGVVTAAVHMQIEPDAEAAANGNHHADVVRHGKQHEDVGLRININIEYGQCITFFFTK